MSMTVTWANAKDTCWARPTRGAASRAQMERMTPPVASPHHPVAHPRNNNLGGALRRQALHTTISRRNNELARSVRWGRVALGMQRQRLSPWTDAHRDCDMVTERTLQEQPRRRGVDRRRDLGRRIVRDRRRETLDVESERRSGTDRRSGTQRRARGERRTPPQGFRSIP